MTDHAAGPPGIDLPRLSTWMAERLPEVGPIVDIALIAGGRSNLTYRIDTDRRSVVLRRPPLGHVLPTAHDMSREFRLLSALAGARADGARADGARADGRRVGVVPVPEPLESCTGVDVIGAPFYVMDHVEGRVLRTVEDAADVTPAQARALSERLVEALAAIHLLDVERAGLGDFGRPEGYMARQLKRWGQQWERSHEAIVATGTAREVPGYREIVRRFADRLPSGGPTGLVHGDFRLDNALVRLAPEPTIAAVVDWEMSTLGDPLADLGLTLTYWTDPGDDERMGIPVGSTVTSAPGFLTGREFADRYASLTGYDISNLDFYVAFGNFKLAVILEGIHARFLQKETVGDGFEEVGAAVPVLIERALRVLDQ